MSTINISLPQEQVSLVDKFVSAYGFANRSEFIRALLRFVNRQPQAIEEAVVFPFVSPPTKSVGKIMAEFKKTKKYSPAFLKDLEAGLKSSNYFQK